MTSLTQQAVHVHTYMHMSSVPLAGTNLHARAPPFNEPGYGPVAAFSLCFVLS